VFYGGWEVKDRPDVLGVKQSRVVSHASNFEVDDDVLTAPTTLFLFGLSKKVSTMLTRDLDDLSGPNQASLS